MGYSAPPSAALPWGLVQRLIGLAGLEEQGVLERYGPFLAALASSLSRAGCRNNAAADRLVLEVTHNAAEQRLQEVLE